MVQAGKVSWWPTVIPGICKAGALGSLREAGLRVPRMWGAQKKGGDTKCGDRGMCFRRLEEPIVWQAVTMFHRVYGEGTSSVYLSVCGPKMYAQIEAVDPALCAIFRSASGASDGQSYISSQSKCQVSDDSDLFSQRGSPNTSLRLRLRFSLGVSMEGSAWFGMYLYTHWWLWNIRWGA